MVEQVNGKVPYRYHTSYLIENPRRGARLPALRFKRAFGVRYNLSELLAVADRRPDRRYLENPGLSHRLDNATLTRYNDVDTSLGHLAHDQGL